MLARVARMLTRVPAGGPWLPAQIMYDPLGGNPVNNWHADTDWIWGRNHPSWINGGNTEANAWGYGACPSSTRSEDPGTTSRCGDDGYCVRLCNHCIPGDRSSYPGRIGKLYLKCWEHDLVTSNEARAATVGRRARPSVEHTARRLMWDRLATGVRLH